MKQEIYRTFWETRSLLQTCAQISKKFDTKHGARFTTSTIRLILRNPICCVADKFSYNYFLEHDGNLFGDMSEFDGQHGLSSYNKTNQIYGNRKFWRRGYYVDTCGKNAKKIEEYIKNQLMDDQAYDQLSLKEFIDPFMAKPVVLTL